MAALLAHHGAPRSWPFHSILTVSGKKAAVGTQKDKVKEGPWSCSRFLRHETASSHKEGMHCTALKLPARVAVFLKWFLTGQSHYN